MSFTETGAGRIRGREYPCYCKMPWSLLKALPEREQARAWDHINKHLDERAAR